MTKIISEIGWNHMGDMVFQRNDSCFKRKWRDIVKFQTWSVSRLKSGRGMMMVEQKFIQNRSYHLMTINN